jgi:hypothetical protein
MGCDQAWDAVDTNGLEEDIWSLAFLDERRYLSTFQDVCARGG